MTYLRVKNLEQYQHYSTRNPPWIKLYRTMLSDYEMRQLSIPARYCYIGCLILASETDNRIPHDPKYLSERFGMSVSEAILTALIDSGFLLASGARRELASIQTPSSLLSSVLINPPNPDLIPDLKSKTETQDFEQFWLAYPKKVGKKDALKAWEKAKDRPALSEMLAVLIKAKGSEQWLKDNGQFIPNPSTWITQGRWDDQPMVTKGNGKRPPPFPPKTDPIARGQWRAAYGDPQEHGYE
jgi:hypothetical protein